MELRGDWLVGAPEQHRWQEQVLIEDSLNVYLWFWGCTYSAYLTFQRNGDRIQIVNQAKDQAVVYSPIEISDYQGTSSVKVSDWYSQGLVWREELSVSLSSEPESRKLNLRIGDVDRPTCYYLVGGDEPVVLGRNRTPEADVLPCTVLLRKLDESDKNRAKRQELISRNHAVIVSQSDGFVVKDTSTYGTTVGYSPSNTVQLTKDGETFRFDAERMASKAGAINFVSLGFVARLFASSIPGTNQIGPMQQIANFLADSRELKSGRLALRLEREGGENVDGAEVVVLVPLRCQVGPPGDDCTLAHPGLRSHSLIWFIGGKYWLQSPSVVRDVRSDQSIFPAFWPIPLKLGARVIVDGVTFEVGANRLQPSYVLECRILEREQERMKVK